MANVICPLKHERKAFCVFMSTLTTQPWVTEYVRRTRKPDRTVRIGRVRQSGEHYGETEETDVRKKLGILDKECLLSDN